MFNRRQFTTLTLATTLLAGTGIRAAYAAPGPIDVSKVRSDIFAAKSKKLTMATVVKVDGIAWFDRMREGVKEFGQLTGDDVRMVGPRRCGRASSVG